VAVRVAVERGDRLEANVGKMREPRPAIVHLKLVELRADRRRGPHRRRPEQRKKRPVAAAVVEDVLSAESLCEPQRRLEPSTVTPRDEPVLAEDLLRGVMPLANRGVYRSLGGQNFFSRASHVPRTVIQNDNRIRRRSSRNDRRRMYNRSNR